MDLRLEVRRKDFKKTIEDPRRRREEAQVQIRKSVRDNRLTKKRMEALTELGDNPGAPASSPVPSSLDIPELGTILKASEDPQELFRVTQAFRKMLSIQANPPIQEVIQADCVPRFVQLLSLHQYPELQFEAAWALTNIASGTHPQTDSVVAAGAVPILIQLATSERIEVCEQAIWALGNIAGDCAQSRDMLIKEGVLTPLIFQLREVLRLNHSLSLMRNAAWTLSNLCRGKPRPSLEVIKPILPILKQLIDVSDAEVICDTCWGFSYISDGNDKEASLAIGAVIETGVPYRLVELLGHRQLSVYTPALRTIGNIVSGDETQTQTMVMSGCLPALKKLLEDRNKSVRKEACWTISNIAAGTTAQIDEVIKHGLIPQMLSLARVDPNEIKKEISWAIANAASGASASQVEYLVSVDCLPCLSDCLTSIEARLVAVALEALNNILKVGREIQTQRNLPTNAYIGLMEECKISDRLEALQFGGNGTVDLPELRRGAGNLLSQYFSPLDEEVLPGGGDVEFAP